MGFDRLHAGLGISGEDRLVYFFMLSCRKLTMFLILERGDIKSALLVYQQLKDHIQPDTAAFINLQDLFQIKIII